MSIKDKIKRINLGLVGGLIYSLLIGLILYIGSYKSKKEKRDKNIDYECTMIIHNDSNDTIESYNFTIPSSEIDKYILIDGEMDSILKENQILLNIKRNVKPEKTEGDK